jgi:enamine deaminase RidA (YjgF/YER057c/UK114 family)
MAKVLKVNVFIKDMNDFKAINDVYAVSGHHSLRRTRSSH